MLSPEMLPAVPHITFGIFNLAVPNLIAWISIIVVFVAAARARLPRIFEPEPQPVDEGSWHESHT